MTLVRGRFFAPNGKGKVLMLCLIMVVSVPYQFPMGKVQPDWRTFEEVTSEMYQFPMGKVQRVKYSASSKIFQYQFPIGKGKKCSFFGGGLALRCEYQFPIGKGKELLKNRIEFDFMCINSRQGKVSYRYKYISFKKVKVSIPNRER